MIRDQRHLDSDIGFYKFENIGCNERVLESG